MITKILFKVVILIVYVWTILQVIKLIICNIELWTLWATYDKSIFGLIKTLGTTVFFAVLAIIALMAAMNIYYHYIHKK